jgi:hypothetical protein
MDTLMVMGVMFGGLVLFGLFYGLWLYQKDNKAQ